MKAKNNILVIDPILRGSRLFYTWMVASGGYNRGYNINILTRSYAVTDHFQELFHSIQFRLHDVIELPENFWYGKIPKDQTQKAINFIRQNQSEYSNYYFTGINEFLPNILFELEKYSNELGKLNIRMVDYDANFLIKRNKNSFSLIENCYHKMRKIKHSFDKKKHSKKCLLNKLLYKYSKLKFFLLDERAFDSNISKIGEFEKNRMIFLPDPGPSVQIDRKKNSDGYIKILIVGLQSKRKGIREIFRLLAKYRNQLTNVKFLLAGRFDEKTDFLKKDIANYKDSLEYHQGFFSENKIKEFYETADYVILPYKKSFSGSSGVLAYSTAFGKPVVATSHGCIGYRIMTYNLGYVYESGKIKELSQLIKKLPPANTREYQNLSANCKRFAEKRSIDAHQKTIFNNI